MTIRKRKCKEDGDEMKRDSTKSLEGRPECREEIRKLESPILMVSSVLRNFVLQSPSLLSVQLSLIL